MTATSTLSSASVQTSPRQLIEHFKTAEGKKKIKYAAVSAVAILVGAMTTLICYNVIGWDEHEKRKTLIAAFIVSSIPAYYLNRLWVWGKSGRSSLMKETVPFWVVSFIQFGISYVYVQWAQGLVEAHTANRLFRAAGIQFNQIFIYGIMWIGKYIFFNKVLFAHKHEAAAS